MFRCCRYKAVLAALAAASALFFPHASHAAMLFCNHTKGAIDVAIGYQESKRWVSEGWWRIEPGLCARVYRKSLQPRNYFYYAAALNKLPDGSRKTWGGEYGFCIAEKAFRSVGHDGCAEKGFEPTGFAQVPVAHGTRDYTLEFND